jgi:alpha-tubulin suppressor-like RCC1 family protein
LEAHIWNVLPGRSILIVACAGLSLGGCADNSAPPTDEPEPGLFATEISAGGALTCAVEPSQLLICWGWENGYVAPFPLLGSDAYRTASLEHYGHNCALTAAGKARCWGTMQLNSTYFTFLPRPYLEVAAELDLVSVTTGSSQACGTLANGTAVCWGSYNGGVRGTGTPATEFTDFDAPNGVAGGLRFSQVVAGYGFSCGLSTDGRAYCWGVSQQLGAPDAPLASAEECLGIWYVENLCALGPVPVASEQRFIELSAAGHQTCGRTQEGQVFCWAADPPAPVTLPVAAASLNVGAMHSCILDQAGQAFCWGTNGYGQLGRLPLSHDPLGPAPVETALRFSQISAGGEYTCGLQQNTGAVYCWGRNSGGQLGTKPDSGSVAPVRVPAGRR